MTKAAWMTDSERVPGYRIARDLASGKVFPVSEALILQTAR
jgi:hypothetical protein